MSSYSRGTFTNVIFLHYSTGRNLIEQGRVRERFLEAGYGFWDHDYNSHGLRRADGVAPFEEVGGFQPFFRMYFT